MILSKSVYRRWLREKHNWNKWRSWTRKQFWNSNNIRNTNGRDLHNELVSGGRARAHEEVCQPEIIPFRELNQVTNLFHPPFAAPDDSREGVHLARTNKDNLLFFVCRNPYTKLIFPKFFYTPPLYCITVFLGPKKKKNIFDIFYYLRNKMFTKPIVPYYSLQ